MSHNLEGLHPGPELVGIIRPLGTPNVVDTPDVFPPSRSQAPDPSIFLPYITEDIAFEEEYEEYLSDLGYSDHEPIDGQQQLFGGVSAWHRLPEFASTIADNISDSESVVTIGDLGDGDPVVGGITRDLPDENLNNWEVRLPTRYHIETYFTLFTAHESENDGSTSEITCKRAQDKFRRWPSPCSALRSRRRECCR